MESAIGRAFPNEEQDHMITRFFVDNFKGLRDFEVHFTEPLSVLAGPNGSGKTSICQAIELFFRLVRERPADIMKEMDPLLLKNKWKTSSKVVMEADVRVCRDRGHEDVLTWRIEIAKKKGWGIAAEQVTHHGADIPGNATGDRSRELFLGPIYLLTWSFIFNK